jgi:hypothetical protein
MVIRRKEGPNGPEHYRPPYRPEDYTVHFTALKGINNWRGGGYGVDDLLEEREGPFIGWEVISRFERDGKRWVRLFHTSAEYLVDCELLPFDLGEVVPVDPAEAYQIAIERDRKRAYPVTVCR